MKGRETVKNSRETKRPIAMSLAIIMMLSILPIMASATGSGESEYEQFEGNIQVAPYELGVSDIYGESGSTTTCYDDSSFDVDNPTDDEPECEQFEDNTQATPYELGISDIYVELGPTITWYDGSFFDVENPADFEFNIHWGRLGGGFEATGITQIILVLDVYPNYPRYLEKHEFSVVGDKLIINSDVLLDMFGSGEVCTIFIGAKFCDYSDLWWHSSINARSSADEDITDYFSDLHFRAGIRSNLGIADDEPILRRMVENRSGMTFVYTSYMEWNGEEWVWVSIPGQIQSLAGIEHFIGLECLFVGGNYYLTSIDLSNNTALLRLDLRSNGLTSLDVSSNTALTELDVSSNLLTSLDLSNNPELWLLDASDNQLSLLDVSNNPKLWRLDVSDNQLSLLNVSNNTNLSILTVRSNKLTTLDVSNNPELWHLDVYDNQLTDLNVSGNAMLGALDVRLNNMSDVGVINGVGNTNLPDVDYLPEWQFRFYPQR